MQWISIPLGALLLQLATLPVAAAAEEPVLNVYNWADYIHPDITGMFEEEYGIKVNYDIYDSAEIVDTKLMTGHSGYDIIIHSAAFASRLKPVGAFHPIDFKSLKNWHHIVDVMQVDFNCPGAHSVWAVVAGRSCSTQPRRTLSRK
ncbi:MAG: hypothetical protein O7F73_01515 [Gammaproteobacteria bacterium]|nr:hypothetical protein [Gammaproteobacteria bacterium]